MLGQSIDAPVLLNEGGSPSCEGAGGLAVGPHRVCQASGQAERSLPSGPPPRGTLPPPGPARDLPEGSLGLLGLPLLIRIPAHRHVVGGALQIQVCMEHAFQSSSRQQAGSATEGPWPPVSHSEQQGWLTQSRGQLCHPEGSSGPEADVHGPATASAEMGSQKPFNTAGHAPPHACECHCPAMNHGQWFSL